MIFFEHYYKNVIKYDLMYKFLYININEIPKLEKLVLTFTYRKETDLKLLATQIVALEVLSSQKGYIVQKKTASISLSIRKGNPVGCKVTLRKQLMYMFFIKLIFDFFPRIKNLQQYSSKNDSVLKNSFSFHLKKIMVFPELGDYYQVFNNLSELNIVITVCKKNRFDELFFLLKSFKFPLMR